MVTAKQFKQCHRYNKIRKAFSKFYRRHSEVIVKYNIVLKIVLQTEHVGSSIVWRFSLYSQKNCC